MRRVRNHDDDGVGFFRNLLAGFADLAACGNEFWCNGPDVVKKQAMSGGLKMASHRTSHGSQANEANINHFCSSLSMPAMCPWFASRAIRDLRSWTSAAYIRNRSSRDIRSGRDGETGRDS